MPQTVRENPASAASPLSQEELKLINAYWRAANYLSVGQVYLYENPLLTKPLKLEHIKPRLLGHWGTTPGLNFVYAHCNRIIKKYDLNMIYIWPGRDMADRAWWRIPIWKARTASYTRTFERTRRG